MDATTLAAALALTKKMISELPSPSGQSVNYELIKEETFTKETEADHVITTDSNGNAFELTDLVLMFETPSQATLAKKGSYGSFQLWYGTGNYDYYGINANAWEQAANTSAHGCCINMEQKGGLVFFEIATNTTSTNNMTTARRYKEGFVHPAINPAPSGGLFINKIVIPAVTGTGHYKLYGKRRQTT